MIIRQAIRTRYLPPTNFRPARIVAESQGRRQVYPWNHGADPDRNHAHAAREYAGERGWTVGTTGVLPDGSYCHTLAE